MSDQPLMKDCSEKKKKNDVDESLTDGYVSEILLRNNVSESVVMGSSEGVTEDVLQQKVIDKRDDKELNVKRVEEKGKKELEKTTISLENNFNHPNIDSKRFITEKKQSTYNKLREYAHRPHFWLEQSVNRLDYFKRPTKGLKVYGDESNLKLTFFEDGVLNGCYEIIDKWILKGLKDKECLIFDCTDDESVKDAQRLGNEMNERYSKNRSNNQENGSSKLTFSYNTNYKLEISNSLITMKYTYEQVLENVCNIAGIIQKILKRKGYDVGEVPSFKDLTYEELIKDYLRVFENKESVKKERIVACIYMPMSEHTVFATLACARLGITHNIVFGGYSCDSLIDRINDSDSKLLITCCSSVRGKQTLDFFSRVKNIEIENILVLDRPRDHDFVEEFILNNNNEKFNFLSQFKKERFIRPVPVDSEHPLFILYTSGSTGKPKGLVHSTAGYLTYASYSTEMVFYGQKVYECKSENFRDFYESYDERLGKFVCFCSDHDSNVKNIDDDNKTYDITTVTRSTTENDKPFFCTADLGWITGHTYCLYGPLSLNKSSVILTGLPTAPDTFRLWRMIESYGIGVFYTAPTLIRCLRKILECEEDTSGYQLPALRQSRNTEKKKDHNLSSLEVLGSVGEPISFSTYSFYSSEFNNQPIVDCYWQTETGGIICSNALGVDEEVGESCGRGLPGLDVFVIENNDNIDIDENVIDKENLSKEGDFIRNADLYPFFTKKHNEFFLKNNLRLSGHNTLGLIIFYSYWPGMARTILNDHEKFVENYLKDGVYYPGDEGVCYVRNDQLINPYIFVRGRADDVINVSGHRISTAEVESCVNSYSKDDIKVIESAVIGVPDAITGLAIVLFVVADFGSQECQQETLKTEIKKYLRSKIGSLINPKEILLIQDLPKTRTGKIMRRILKKIMMDQELGDVSTMGNSSCLEGIYEVVKKK